MNHRLHTRRRLSVFHRHTMFFLPICLYTLAKISLLMSTSDTAPVQLEREGIHVSKQFTTEEFAVPVVRFVFKSTLDEPVTVRLLDSIPTEFDLEGSDPGFHPDFEGEYWELLEGNRVRFERVLEPGEEVETLYGVPGPTEDDAYLFETDPTLYVNAVDGESLPESDGVVEDEIDLDEGDESAEAEHDEPEDAEEAEHEEDTEDETEDAEVESAEETDSSSPDEDHDVVIDGSVASALLAELSSGELSDENREALIEALGGSGNDAPARLHTQLEHLQSRVSEFEAYIDAVGDFIDEEGNAQQLLQSYKDEVAGLREQVSGLGDGLDDDVAANSEAVEELSSELQSLNEEIEALFELEDRVAGVEGLQERVEQLGGMDERVEALEGLEPRVSEVEGLEGRVDDLADQLENFDGLETVREQLDDLDGRLEDVESSMADEDRVAAIEQTLNDMKDELDDVSSGINVLRQAFGGAMATAEEQEDDE